MTTTKQPKTFLLPEDSKNTSPALQAAILAEAGGKKKRARDIWYRGLRPEDRAGSLGPENHAELNDRGSLPWHIPETVGGELTKSEKSNIIKFVTEAGHNPTDLEWNGNHEWMGNPYIVCSQDPGYGYEYEWWGWAASTTALIDKLSYQNEHIFKCANTDYLVRFFAYEADFACVLNPCVPGTAGGEPGYHPDDYDFDIVEHFTSVTNAFAAVASRYDIDKWQEVDADGTAIIDSDGVQIKFEKYKWDVVGRDYYPYGNKDENEDEHGDGHEYQYLVEPRRKGKRWLYISPPNDGTRYYALYGDGYFVQNNRICWYEDRVRLISEKLAKALTYPEQPPD